MSFSPLAFSLYLLINWSNNNEYFAKQTKADGRAIFVLLISSSYFLQRKLFDRLHQTCTNELQAVQSKLQKNLTSSGGKFRTNFLSSVKSFFNFRVMMKSRDLSLRGCMAHRGRRNTSLMRGDEEKIHLNQSSYAAKILKQSRIVELPALKLSLAWNGTFFLCIALNRRPNLTAEGFNHKKCYTARLRREPGFFR